jgi:hypothetical protein
MRPAQWVTTYDDSRGGGFLVQMSAAGTGWVDVRVFRAICLGALVEYGSDLDDATADLDKAPQFARGSCKEDGGWYLRIEFCDLTERRAMVEVNAAALAKVLQHIDGNTPVVAAGYVE